MNEKYVFDKTLLKVQSFITDYSLLTHESKVLVGTSGGADSIFLLYALLRLGYNVGAAHLNHCIRGEEADADQQFVSEFCSRLKIPFYTDDIDVLDIARSEKLSSETAARRERYAFFRRVYESEDFDRLATGHHLNDNAESFIMHLLRGSGMKGIGGIRPKSSLYGMNVVRPILCLSKREILQYCSDNDMSFCTDSTNYDEVYRRNDIRLNVIPALEERGGLNAIFRLCNIAETENNFLGDYTESLIKSNVSAENEQDSVLLSFKLSWFNKLHVACKRRILFKLFSTAGVSHCTFLHINEAIALCEKNYGGKYLKLPGRVKFFLRKGIVSITKKFGT